MVKKLSILLCAFLCAVSVSVSANELYFADVLQMHCFSDIMRTYVELSDKNSSPIEKPSRADVVGYIDGVTLTTQSINRFGDTGEGTADIFLVDVSGSIKNAQLDKVKSAIKTWASNMKPNDRIAVVSFGDSIETLTDFSGDINAVSAAADKLTNHGSKTQLYGGISHAVKLASRNDTDLPKRKNIILITDGVNDSNGGISENDMLKELKTALVPVYSLWMSNSRANNSKGRSTLNSVTDYSGGRIYDMSDKSIETVYGWVKDNINNSYTVDFAYNGTVPDNNIHKFSIKVAQNGRIFEDSVDFTMKKSEENSHTYSVSATSEEETDEKSNIGFILIIVLIAVLVAGAAVALIIIIRNKNNTDEYIYPISSSDYTPQDDTGSKTINADYTAAVHSTNNVVFVSMRTGKRNSISISGSILAGRSGQCDFIIENDTVSGNHAVITLANEKLYVEDMTSANGTFVNGRKTNGITKLKNNDIVMFGNEEYKVNF